MPKYIKPRVLRNIFAELHVDIHDLFPWSSFRYDNHCNTSGHLFFELPHVQVLHRQMFCDCPSRN